MRMTLTRGQTNEMAWASRHLLPEVKCHRPAKQTDLKGRMKTQYWHQYCRAMRGIDKRTDIIPLSRFSPGALQKIWEETVAPTSFKLAKEVYKMNKGMLNLLDVVTANSIDERIYPSSVASTQSPPAS